MAAPTILLIRSDEETHRSLRARLEECGYEVIAATGQSEAVRLAAALGPDLLVQEESVRLPEESAVLDHVVRTVHLLTGTSFVTPLQAGDPSCAGGPLASSGARRPGYGWSTAGRRPRSSRRSTVRHGC